MLTYINSVLFFILYHLHHVHNVINYIILDIQMFFPVPSKITTCICCVNQTHMATNNNCVTAEFFSCNVQLKISLNKINKLSSQVLNVIQWNMSLMLTQSFMHHNPECLLELLITNLYWVYYARKPCCFGFKKVAHNLDETYWVSELFEYFLKGSHNLSVVCSLSSSQDCCY